MAFAVHGDVAKRLRRTLTTAEQEAATDVISVVTGLIVDAADKSAAWATALSPVPTALKELCVQKALWALNNPTGVASESLGAHSVTFSRAQDAGVFLTAVEERLARLAVHGTLSGSARAESLIDTALDLADDGEINNSLAS